MATVLMSAVSSCPPPVLAGRHQMSEVAAELRRLYGFRSFSGHAARELGDRLREEALTWRADASTGLMQCEQ